jgi:hypothetical protein
MSPARYAEAMRRRMISATVLLALTPGTALAAGGSLQPGVHVDPGSPAGKQYQIPIAAARGETSSGHGSANSSNPPLFGAGITAASQTPARSTAAGASTGSARAHRAARAHHRRDGSGASKLPTGATPADIGAGPAGDRGWLALAAGGFLVLLLGGAGTLVLRRQTRSRP